MRQSLIVTSLTGSLIVFCLSIDLFNALFMFVLFGILPGRVTPLPAGSMLVVYSAAAVLVSLYALRGGISAIMQALSHRVGARHSSTS